MLVAQLEPMRIAALLVGLLIGVGLTMALVKSDPIADAGDWLTFTGALVGVVATILGTLWLEHHRSAVLERKQRSIVVGTLKEIRSALAAASLPRGDDPIEVARPERVASERALSKVFDKFVYARHFIPNDDINCWQAIEALHEAMNEEKKLIDHEAQLLNDIGENEAVFLVNISKMQQIAERLSPLLDTAIREIRD